MGFMECSHVLSVFQTAANSSPIQWCQVPSSVHPSLPLTVTNIDVCSCWHESVPSEL